MRFLPIVPIPELPKIIDASFDMHLLLTHLADNKDYVRFYKKRRELNDYLIVDNSAYELGKSLPLQDVIDFARKVKAQEIVLPDVMGDSVATFELVKSAVHQVPRKFRLMFVPQGESQREWKWCLERCLSEIEYAGHTTPIIGVSKIYEKWQGGRYELLRYLLNFYDDKRIYGVHLLGFASPVQVEVFRRDFPWIRSLDSAKPAVAALSGITFSDRREFQILELKLPKRPNNFFHTSLTESQTSAAIANISMMQSLAFGEMRLI